MSFENFKTEDNKLVRAMDLRNEKKNSKDEVTDNEIIRIVKGFTKGLLGGKPTTDRCFMVCSPLASYLSFCGIECTLTEGIINHFDNEFNHFWITLSDGRIIDPTADQFGLLNIYVRNKPSYYIQK